MPDVPRVILNTVWYDLSPMRPDEFAQVDIGKWSEAMQIRIAYEKAYKQVQDDQQDIDERKRGADAAIERLKSRAQ